MDQTLRENCLPLPFLGIVTKRAAACIRLPAGALRQSLPDVLLLLRDRPL